MSADRAHPNTRTAPGHSVCRDQYKGGDVALTEAWLVASQVRDRAGLVTDRVANQGIQVLALEQRFNALHPGLELWPFERRTRLPDIANYAKRGEPGVATSSRVKFCVPS